MSGPAPILALNLQKHVEIISPQSCKCELKMPINMLNIKLKRQSHPTIRILINLNSSRTQNHLGLEIFAASAGGAYLVTAQRISAAFA
jgi:quinolinate synthase